MTASIPTATLAGVADSAEIAAGTGRALGRIRDDVRAMHAYVVQDAPADASKLDALENPHVLPAALQAELGRRLGALAINRYPANDGNAQLKRALAAHAHLPEGFDLMLGNGSDELISLVTMACDRPGASVLAPVAAACISSII